MDGNYNVTKRSVASMGLDHLRMISIYDDCPWYCSFCCSLINENFRVLPETAKPGLFEPAALEVTVHVGIALSTIHTTATARIVIYIYIYILNPSHQPGTIEIKPPAVVVGLFQPRTDGPSVSGTRGRGCAWLCMFCEASATGLSLGAHHHLTTESMLGDRGKRIILRDHVRQ